MNVSEAFRLGMRRLASGVSVVATRDDDGPKGFLATSVSSVALEPMPCLLVCVNRAVSSHDAFIRTGIFSVNILGEQHADVARRFSSSSHRDSRFEPGKWTAVATGAPIYIDGLASFDCELSTSMAVQTHTILIGRVVSVHAPAAPAGPLIYYGGSFDALRAA